MTLGPVFPTGGVDSQIVLIILEIILLKEE